VRFLRNSTSVWSFAERWVCSYRMLGWIAFLGGEVMIVGLGVRI
jgi:hypothetical protein